MAAAMSRRTPPAEIEDSWPTSPTRRTLAPLRSASVIIASSPAVAALPASSTMIRVSGPTCSNQSG